ncbi:hypothetical protein GA0070607_2033 [Micromonospora coriariae]|uniref:Uncharacterized protein n=1 Tax=Micromonospora coriariae TaxID=285665 RepID=A0A1C4VFM8_9ACTN|nr:hypothetical protein GA0070607_2033 [Micromonospora coriariae]
MPQVLVYLFGYFLLTIPAFLGLALIAQIGRSTRVRRAGELVLVTGVVALTPVVAHRALEVPALWLAVALLVVVLAVSVARQLRSRS